MASHLIGIDLSPEMADRAGPLYDSMIVGDVSATLTELGPIADAVLCLGATYYFDDLTPFLIGAASSMKPGGWLLFSDYVAPEGCGLMSTIDGTFRYCRAPDLLRRQASEAGLVEVGYRHGISFGLPARFWCFAKAEVKRNRAVGAS